MIIDRLISDEAWRQTEFPVCRNRIFLAHAGVTALPRRVADAVVDYTRAASEDHQEFGDVLRRIHAAREDCAELIGAGPDEIALLGPTSLGLSLFARGLAWQAGDELLCYGDDYPANVYPWIDLRRQGVVVNLLRPEAPGAITPELVEAALTPRTRLVALASCHFLSGYRIDVDAIGRLLRSRGVLFSLDAIQTLGAFPTRVEHVDFLSADSHKWLLGPLTAGIVFVRREHFDRLHPILLGAWNVRSPNFVAQDEIRLPRTGQRYEPGVLNAAGIFGMQAAIGLLREAGYERVTARLLQLKQRIVARLQPEGFEFLGPIDGPNASSITTVRHPGRDMTALFRRLEENRVAVSLRHDRSGTAYLRISPHFYNTEPEIDRVLGLLTAVSGGTA